MKYIIYMHHELELGKYHQRYRKSGGKFKENYVTRN